MRKRILSAIALTCFLIISCTFFQTADSFITPTESIEVASTSFTPATSISAPPTATLEPQVNKTNAGFIASDEIWRGEYRVTGDIWVYPGVTLTIEPGTTVLIAANSDEHNLLEDELDLRSGINQGERIDGIHTGEPFRDELHHISLWVEGTLSAVGTEQQPITITSDSPSPTPYDWNRIQIWHGRISFATIEYYRIIHTMMAEVEITNSTLRFIGECGICAYANAQIISNRIYDAGHELIDVDGSPIIRDNLLGPNPDRACIHIVRGEPLIENNQLIEPCN